MHGCFERRLFALAHGLLQTELNENVLGAQKFFERLVGNDVQLIDVGNSRVRPERQAQAATHRLLRKDFGGHSTKRHDNTNVLYVPTLLKLVDRDDGQHGGTRRVHVLEKGLGRVVFVVGIDL